MLNGFPLASYAQICLKTIFPHGWLFCITHAVIGAGSGMAAGNRKGDCVLKSSEAWLPQLRGSPFLLAGVALASCSSTGGPSIDSVGYAPAATASGEKAADIPPGRCRRPGRACSRRSHEGGKGRCSRGSSTSRCEAGRCGPSQKRKSKPMSQPLPRQARRLRSLVAEAKPAADTGANEPATAEKTDSAAEAPATVAPARSRRSSHPPPHRGCVEPSAKKRGFLSSFYRTTPAAAAPSPIVPKSSPVKTASATDEDVRPKILPVAAEPAREPRKIVQPRLGNQSEMKVAALAVRRSLACAPDSLIAITRKNGVDDDSGRRPPRRRKPAP